VLDELDLTREEAAASFAFAVATALREIRNSPSAIAPALNKSSD
jgi:hypothetical protein